MKTTRKIIKIDEELCNGCGLCVPSCAEGAIQVIDGKAKLVAEKYCDGLGACLGDCPTGALTIEEREVEAFDEAAVEEHLETLKQQEEPAPAAPAGGGCPSAQVRTMAPASGCPGSRMQTVGTGGGAVAQGAEQSALTHWPVQIRLVPPTAPFLDGADVLVAADCVPVAYPNFHRDFLEGNAVMIGCPKFDDAELYIQRFKDIFAGANVKSVTAVVMQVPCCQGLPVMIEQGIKASGKDVPLEKVVVSLEGEVLSREQLV